MDDHQLWRTLFLIKDFLIKHNQTKFVSFDITDNPNQIHGNSFKIPVLYPKEVLYFLDFYDLSNGMTELDVKMLKIKKGYSGSYYLILLLQ